MNIRMPGTGGTETMRRIREADARLERRTFVAALTAYAMQEDRNCLLSAGFDAYLSKQIRMDEWNALLKSMAMS